jgi:hypothetical protein
MPYSKSKNVVYYHHNHKTTDVLIQKEIVIERPVMNGSMESLTVDRLMVRDISLSDPSIFYPPDPHIFKEAYLEFSSDVVGFKAEKTFLEYNKRTDIVSTENLDTQTLTAHTVDISLLRADRLETSENMIGGIILRNGGFSAPGNVNVGSHFIASTGNIGGVSLKQGIVRGDILDVTSTQSNLTVSGDLTCKVIKCKRLEIDEFPSIVTDSDSVHSIGNLSISEGAAYFSGKFTSLCMSTEFVESEKVSTQHLDVHTLATMKELTVEKMNTKSVVIDGTVKAHDFRLQDGTSILNGVFPLGMIMLYNGKVPPRGWLECNGKGGTPVMDSPAPNVIYIVRR